MKFYAALLLVGLMPAVCLYGQSTAGVYDTEPGSSYQQEGDLWREESAARLLFMPLQAYPNVFTALSDYNFSFVRHLRRGYDYGMERVTINGADLSDRFTGNQYWNVLTAANSALSVGTEKDGLAVSEHDLGSVGGIRSYDTDAGALTQKLRVGWMGTDRKFRNGFRVEVASGWNPDGWAFAMSTTGRVGRDAHIKGIYSDNWTFSASVARKFGDKHMLSASLIGASLEQGVRGSTVAEVFELSGDRLYNLYWGDNNGAVYTSRVRSSFQPMGSLNWNWKPSAKLEITTTLAGLWGENKYSSLRWYDAVNPHPDYHRYLPSFSANPVVSDIIREAWESGNRSVTQIDWRELYRVNCNGADTPASYVVGSDAAHNANYQFASRFRYDHSSLFRLSGGIRARVERVSRYRVLDNLLGANYLLDIDQYLIDDEYFGDKLQNNTQSPNRHVTEGERYGYDYDLHHLSVGAWAVAEWYSRRSDQLHGYVGLQAAQVAYDRDGHYEKELYPGNASYGRSRRLEFTDYMLKGGIDYRFTPAHSLALNVAYGDVAPAAEDLFISPDYQNRTIDNPCPVNLLSGELSYRFARRAFQFMLTGYATTSTGEAQVYHYYDDLSSEFSNAVLSGVSKLYAGVELGLSFDLTPRLSLRLGASVANYCYRNDPVAAIYADKDGRVLAQNTRAYIKGYRLGASPQQTASGELRYSGANYWTVALAVNYVGDRYVGLNPLRRMRRVCDYASSPEVLKTLLEQERLPDATTVDLFVNKSFRIKSHFLSISASIRNIANHRDIVYSGYEQMRLRKTGTGINQDIEPFGAKYQYAYPRTYYLTINYSF